MGSGSSIPYSKQEIEDLEGKTGFTSGQIKRLHARFQTLDKENRGYLTKSTLSKITDLERSTLRDHIIEVIINDYGTDDKLNFKQFVQVLAIFRRKAAGETQTGANSRDNKLKFIFNMYDRDKDEKISKSELMSILNLLVGTYLPDEQMNAIAERTIAELGPITNDIDSGSITYEKFCETLAKIDIDEKMSMKFLS